jgi:predicted homoserine dehydrogenase-like protein
MPDGDAGAVVVPRLSRHSGVLAAVAEGKCRSGKKPVAVMSARSTGLDDTPLARVPRRPVRAGVIGCGTFGSGIVAHSSSVPLLEVPAAADHDLDAARRAFRCAGLPEEAIVTCDSPRSALRAMEAGKRVVTRDPLLVTELPLDVIVEATGDPESGARHAESAIRHGQHVAMVNKEADVSVGPILKRLADEAGVVYTAVDGDQHGLLIGLVAWAGRLGLEVLCGGKSRDREVTCDRSAGALSSGTSRIDMTAEEAAAFDPLPPREPEQHLAARRARLGEWGHIGGWDLVELVIAANATGLVPDLPTGVHCPAVSISEIPHVLCPTEMGGILRSRGVIDAVTCLRQPKEAGLGGGVFVVVTASSEGARDVLRRGAVCSNVEGTAALITRPYHLLGVEAIHSILAAALVGTGAGYLDYQPRFDVLTRAARDLDAGTVLGDDHSRDLERFICPAAPLAEGRPLPAHLANGYPLVRPVARGTVITREMVVAPMDSSLWALRARQDAVFFSS